MAKVYIKTLGCKVNHYDSDDLASQFARLGYTITDSQETADLSVINTCTVTENANREARYLLRRFKRQNPESVVVATGCYAQTEAEQLAELDEVDFVVPNKDKSRLGESLAKAVSDRDAGDAVAGQGPSSKILADSPTKGVKEHFKTSLNLSQVDSTRTRAFLKIQDGCDSFCTYCIIPFARGKSRSAPFAEVVAEVRRLVARGYQEIVFTGIHIGDYGDEPDFDRSAFAADGWTKPFAALMATLLAEPEMARIRISSLEPREVSGELLKALSARTDRVCPHFHLPLQSGCDRILKRMNRGYTAAQYRATIAELRAVFPNANIGADIIPGFPGETDEDHRESLEFVEDVGLDYLHVFPYSMRKGTVAARMPDHIDPKVLKTRKQDWLDLGEKLKTHYLSQQMGREVSVLVQDQRDGSGRQKGITENYLQASLASDALEAPPQVGSLYRGKVMGQLAGAGFLIR